MLMGRGLYEGCASILDGRGVWGEGRLRSRAYGTGATVAEIALKNVYQLTPFLSTNNTTTGRQSRWTDQDQNSACGPLEWVFEEVNTKGRLIGAQSVVWIGGFRCHGAVAVGSCFLTWGSACKDDYAKKRCW